MSATAAALEALWQVMVEMTEAAHEAIVLHQRTPTITSAAAIAQSSANLAAIASTAPLLARLANGP